MPESTTRNLDGITNYTKFWQKDSKNDTDVDMANRLTEYTSVVNGEISYFFLPSSLVTSYSPVIPLMALLDRLLRRCH